MNIKPIKSEADYKLALKRLEEVFDASIGTSESDEADILGVLVDEYEKKHYQIEARSNRSHKDKDGRATIKTS